MIKQFKIENSKFKIQKALAIMLLFGLFAMALIPINEFPLWFRKASDPSKNYDLVQHFLVFGGLTFYFYKIWPAKSTLFYVALVALLLELFQSFTGFRTASWTDLLADFAGIILGYYSSQLRRRATC